jgi:20S proteasome subunit beta 6
MYFGNLQINKVDLMNFPYWQLILSQEFPRNSFPLNTHATSSFCTFTPYQNNGGTIISINMEDFSIVASDTRISSGFTIPSRETMRIIKISENILLSTSGMRVDMLVLQEEFKKTVNLWEIENKKTIPVSSGAYILSSILYSRRFFPYYTFNIVSGKELNGTIKSFSFDAVGSFESCVATSSGTGQHFIQPLLDNQFKHQSTEKTQFKKNNILKNLMMVKYLFLKASKRNIEIGDGIQIFILTRRGILVENSVLRCD